MQLRNHPLVRVGALLLLLYLFFTSIAMMGASFKLFGKGFAEQLLTTTANPLVGLFIGILATSVVQSSSTTTSLVVGLVAGGALNIQGAIPIIMGANIGTSVTNTMVSLAHLTRTEEFKRAFAAATVHDFFNLIAVVLLFPLQYLTNFLGIAAGGMATAFANVGGLKVANPLKMATKPAVGLVENLVAGSGTLMLIIAILLLFLSLRYLVVLLRSLVIGRVEAFFQSQLFKTAGRAFAVGLVLTIMVQSSSITTSVAVPLAGAGILTLMQIFPMTLGANIGTTITAMLASLVTGSTAPVTVAFAHLLFNVSGIALIWPARRIPIALAEYMAELAQKSKFIPIVYLVLVFFIAPLSIIYLIG